MKPLINIKPTRIAGLEINYSPAGDMLFNLTILKRRADKLEIETIFTEIETWERAKKELPVSVPIALVITGKGILHKKVALSEKDDALASLHKILPNAKSEEFYVQSNPAESNQGFVSIIRRETADSLLKSITDDGYYPIDLTLGPLVLNAVLPLMKQDYETFEIGNYSFQAYDNTITGFELKEKDPYQRKITIADEEIKQLAAISFAAAFRALFFSETAPFIDVPKVDELKEESKQKHLFKVFGWGVLVFFLTTLLVNFLLFDHYNKKANELEGRYNQNKGLLDYISEMKVKLEEKQAFIEKSGLRNHSQASFYADRIALNLSDKIRLTEININPLEKKIKAEEPVLFLQKTIIVKGNCRKSTELNDWIGVLKENKWIASVSVINYKQEKASEPGEFEIKISIL